MLLLIVRGDAVVDDAFISYRYAANWAAGDGLVFNIGERVEGYSCFLWVATLALGARLGFEPPRFAPALGVVIGMASLGVSSRLSRAADRESVVPPIVVPLAYVLSYGFVFYIGAGMDGPLFTLLLLLALELLHEGTRTGRWMPAGLCLVLLEAARVEGFCYALALAGVTAWFELAASPPRRRELALSLVLVGFATIAMFAVRWRVYGLWLSTTLIAKGYATDLAKRAVVGRDREALATFLRVVRAGWRYEQPVAWIALPGVWVLRKGRDAGLLHWLMAAALIVHVGIGVWSGGDWMPFRRFPIMALPLALVLGATGVGSIARAIGNRSSGKVAIAGAVSILMAIWVGSFLEPSAFWQRRVETPRSRFYREFGETLRGVDRGTMLVTNVAGMLPFYAGSRVYVRDLDGLVDRHNALHGDQWSPGYGRTDYAYSYGSPFDVLVVNSTRDAVALARFCGAKPARCERLRWFSSDAWAPEYLFVVADVDHQAADILTQRFHARARPIDDSVMDQAPVTAPGTAPGEG